MKTASYTNATASNDNLYSMFGKLKKIPNTVILNRRYYAVIRLTEVITSNTSGNYLKPKQTIFIIDNDFYNNVTDDTTKSKFYLDNTLVPLRIYEDLDYYYFYCKASSSIYGYYVDFDLMEEHGQTMRATWNNLARLEPIPNSFTEVYAEMYANPLCEILLGFGKSDYTKAFKVMTIHVIDNNKNKYGMIDFSLYCISPNSFYTTDAKVFIHKTQQNCRFYYNATYGSMYYYIENNDRTDSSFDVSLYSTCHGPGGAINLKINNTYRIMSNMITIPTPLIFTDTVSYTKFSGIPIKEWDALPYTLDSGRKSSIVIAAGTEVRDTIDFNKIFKKSPVVTCTLANVNGDGGYLSVMIVSTSTIGFSYSIKNTHLEHSMTVSLNWIALLN